MGNDMRKSWMHIASLALCVTWGTAGRAEELSAEASRAVIQRMIDSLPAGRWIERGVLKIDHTQSLNDGQAVLVEKVTNYVEPDRVLQEFDVVSRTGKTEVHAVLPAAAKKILESAESAGITTPPPTKQIVLREEGRLLTYTSAPFRLATIDESGRFPYQQYNLFLSAGLFQKQGFLSPENLRLATVSGKKDPVGNSLEITVARPDFTAVIALDPATMKPLSCKIHEKNEKSQVWEYEWGGEGKSLPAQVTITKKSRGRSEMDNFRYQRVSDTTEMKDFRVDFQYNTNVEYFPPSTDSAGGAIIYRHNPDIDAQALIARRIQFVLSPQERKNCATAALKAVEEKFGVAFGDTSAIVHLADANQAAGKRPLGVTSAVEIRDLARSKGLYSEVVRTDIEHLAVLGKDTMAILHLPNRNHFILFVGLYGRKDVWVSQSDTRKCLYILGKGDLEAWKGTAVLISSKPILVAQQTGAGIDDAHPKKKGERSRWDCVRRPRLLVTERWIPCFPGVRP